MAKRSVSPPRRDASSTADPDDRIVERLPASMQLEFFFDCSSPWTYLAFERIQPLALEFDVAIRWRPILVGAIFKAVNPGAEFHSFSAQMPKQKLDYYLKDLADWARWTGVRIKAPPTGHPVNSVKVMRACCALAGQDSLVPFARAAFRAYFSEDRLLSGDAVIADICHEAAIDPVWLFKHMNSEEARAALRANVEEAISRGVFGSPTLFLNHTDMYFGVDRLQLLRRAMEECVATARLS